MKQYRVFLLDADETLFDFKRAEAEALQTALQSYGLACGEEIQQRYHQINDGLWKRFETGAVSKNELQTARFSILFRELGIRQDAAAFNVRYMAELGKGAYLLDGAYDVCKKLYERGTKLCIVTNGDAAAQRSRIGRSALGEFFDELFISEELGARKPEKLFFERVLARLGAFDRREMLIVGDSLSSDVAGGNAAEIDTCWFNPRNAENATKAVPTYEIRSLRELETFA